MDTDFCPSLILVYNFDFMRVIRVRKRGVCLSMYVSRMTRSETFLSQKCCKVILEKLLFTFQVSGYPNHYPGVGGLSGTVSRKFPRDVLKLA